MATRLKSSMPNKTADSKPTQNLVGNNNPPMGHASPATSKRDELFRTPLADISGFQFDQHVVDVFPDMLERSIPGYRSIIAQSGLLAARFIQADTHCFDLGCSLGSTLLAMRHAIDTRNADNCRLVGVDNSVAMLEECQRLIDRDTNADVNTTNETLLPVDLVLADIADVPLQPASVVAMNFTLQFVAPGERDTLLQKICDATVSGGALILSEKIKFDDTTLNDLYIDRYHAFKRANGYSDLEISQKRSALEDVLVPDTLETHQARLSAAGYAHSAVWFQCFNFVSIIAVK